ncbi:MAG: SPFH domain-containing protein [Acidobacteriota bacterium]
MSTASSARRLERQKREGLAQFSAHDAYGVRRRELADRMQQFLQQRIAALTAQYPDFAGRAFDIHPVMLRNVGLPASLRGAIELKLAAEQEALKMPFILERELKEAERKKIEAGGIADFQKIVSEGINDSFLRWKGIEATQALAKSENAKIVVIGAGKNGLPVILNPD